MSFTNRRMWCAKAAMVVALAIACAVADADRASGQQYYYQPAPDYYRNDTATDTVVGGALGAITGAAVGGRKQRGEGALIGAGIGAVTGNLLGRAKDRADEQHAAAGAAVVARANQQAAALAVTNYDLVGMSKAGVSDDLMISTLRSRGAQLDLSPQGLISLKQQGVSDRVLLAAQDLNRGGGYAPAPGAVPVVTGFAPPTVIVAPAPWPPYRYGPPPYYYHSRAHFHGHY